MSNSGNPDAGAEKIETNAGSSTDQYVSGAAETGTFLTDQAPAADTPVHGSSNAGINDADADAESPAPSTPSKEPPD
ncbi:hypothetical protein [Actinoplanes sp. NPDC026623]|uniref:hypothetical protein n=1 Tax=Actinoplanes sp. NPDC026623 TaxID=3155610 RepID=UPI0033F9741B